MTQGSTRLDRFMQRRFGLFSIALLLITSLVLLAISLPRIQFNEAGPPASFNLLSGTRERYENPFEDVEAPFQIDLSFEGQRYLVTAWISLVIGGILYAIFTKDGRQNLFTLAIQVGATYLFLTYFGEDLWTMISDLLRTLFSGGSEEQTLREALQTPQFMALAISLVIAAAITLTSWRLFSRVTLPRQKPLFSESISDSINALDRGDELRDVIMQCYQAMLAEVQERRGFTLKQNETASEFRAILIKHGLPASQVTRLTSLFERVRYGQGVSAAHERREARQCLSDFIDACEQLEIRPSGQRKQGMAI